MSDRIALCVGNNYPGTPYELSGCVNDANDWAARLEAAGYATWVMLEPTAADMLDVLERKIAATGWGDRFVFTYSGHGTWVPDVDGDEADRRDEAMVAGDMELVLDDALQAVFAKVARGAGALILSDSCHSGTVSRFMSPPGHTPPADGAVPRFIPPTAFTRNLSETRVAELEARPASTPRPTANLISGCRDTEYSYDAWFGDRPNGAFTRAAIDAYRPGQSLARWFRAIRATLPNDDYPQTPQLTTSSLYRRYAAAL